MEKIGSIDKPYKCPKCDGETHVSDSGRPHRPDLFGGRPCPTCKGEGVVWPAHLKLPNVWGAQPEIFGTTSSQTTTTTFPAISGGTTSSLGTITDDSTNYITNIGDFTWTSKFTIEDS